MEKSAESVPAWFDAEGVEEVGSAVQEKHLSNQGTRGQGLFIVAEVVDDILDDFRWEGGRLGGRWAKSI